MTTETIGKRAEGQPRAAVISVFTNQNREPLSKRRGLDEEGNLRKGPAGRLVRGKVRQQQVGSVREVAELASDLPSCSAIALGICKEQEALVLSRSVAGDYTGTEPMVTRTLEHFRWPEGPGVMLLDHDPAPGQPVLSDAELVDLLRKAVPELQCVAMAVKPSAGSCLHRPDGTELVGRAGRHVFLIVDEAKRIRDLGRIIFDRLWLAGHGHILIDVKGGMHERTLVDASVWSPERLVFGRAHCIDGVGQRFPEPSLFAGSNDDRADREGRLTTLPSLGPAEQARLADLIAAARKEKAEEATAAREKWAEVHGREAAKHKRDRGEDVSDAEEAALIERFRTGAETEVMTVDLILHPEEGGTVTVAEVFADPDRWDGKRFADPFEPGYNNDRRIAMAVMKVGEPYIRSFAHHGMEYLFRSEAERHAATAREFSDLNGHRRFEALLPSVFMSGRQLEWLVKGLLPQAGLGVIFGASGSGKTFFVLDLVLAVAQGEPWRNMKVRQGKVIYIVAEGVEGFRKRLQAYANQHEIDLDSLPFRIIEDAPDLRQDTATLTTEIKEAGGADLIVVDTLAQTTPGVDENSAEAMGEVLKRCRELHEATGGLVCLIHHSGKDPTRGARGWSGLRAAADVELEISRDQLSNFARVTKSKDGKDGDLYAFKLQQFGLGNDADGDPITSCVVEHVYDALPSYRRPKGKWEEAVWKAWNNLIGLDPNGSLEVSEVINEACKGMVYDETGQRDRRREYAARAIDSLSKKALIAVNDNRITPRAA